MPNLIGLFSDNIKDYLKRNGLSLWTFAKIIMIIDLVLYNYNIKTKLHFLFITENELLLRIIIALTIMSVFIIILSIIIHLNSKTNFMAPFRKRQFFIDLVIMFFIPAYPMLINDISYWYFNNLIFRKPSKIADKYNGFVYKNQKWSEIYFKNIIYKFQVITNFFVNNVLNILILLYISNSKKEISTHTINSWINTAKIQVNNDLISSIISIYNDAIIYSAKFIAAHFIIINIIVFALAIIAELGLRKADDPININDFNESFEVVVSRGNNVIAFQKQIDSENSSRYLLLNIDEDFAYILKNFDTLKEATDVIKKI